MKQRARRLWHNGRWTSGVVLLAVLGGMAALAPVLAPHDPTLPLGLTEQLHSPSLAYPFGTDTYGRDVLSRVMYGTQVSMAIALFSVLLSITVGTCVGIAAVYGGKMAGTLLMRFVDAASAVPRVFLLLVVLALWDRVDVVTLVIILGLSSWFGVSRIVRAEVLSIREREFMVAAHSLGIGRARLLLHHLLPNVMAPIVVAATLGMGQIVLIEAGLSFLGVGVQEPTASLGRMMQAGTSQLISAPWTSVFPGLIVVLTVIGFSLIGDGFRDSREPESQ